MNYYERHLGDYARDTGHLSVLEHGVYTLLLDRYYGTESPIPVDQVYRVARARTRDERSAVDAVLSEFFVKSPDGWRNARCDAEIERYMESEPERIQKRENAKERQRRARDRRRDLFEQLRGHGIVPEFDATTAALQAELSRVTKALRHAPVTRDDTATKLQTPDTSSSVGELKESVITEVSAEAPERAPISEAARACVLMGKAGFPRERLNSMHAELIAEIAAGATPEEFAAMAAEVVATGKVPNMGYIVRSVSGRRRDAAAQPRASPASAARGVAANFDGKQYTGATDDELEAAFNRP